MPLNSQVASVLGCFFPFGVWVVLLCFVMSFLIYNTMFQFVYHFGDGIVCLLVSLHFCQVIVLEVYLEVTVIF